MLALVLLAVISAISAVGSSTSQLESSNTTEDHERDEQIRGVSPRPETFTRRGLAWWGRGW